LIVVSDNIFGTPCDLWWVRFITNVSLCLFIGTISVEKDIRPVLLQPEHFYQLWPNRLLAGKVVGGNLESCYQWELQHYLHFNQWKSLIILIF